MGDTSSKYAGPDYSDIAESMASSVATGAIAPMGKSFGKQLYKMGEKAMKRGSKLASKLEKPPMKMAEKAPKINLRKEYKD